MDDLSKYEAMASGIPEIDAITELVDALRDTRKRYEVKSNDMAEWKERAEAAEKELINVRNDLDNVIEENAKLRKALAETTCLSLSYKQEMEDYSERNDALIRKVAELREALKFYAQPFWDD
jgi:chromosome segregation ATPase